jgi:hypothetical protein
MHSRFNVGGFSVGNALAFAMVLVLVGLSACSPTRKVKDGEHKFRILIF